jgi:hypothetical protein
MALPFLSLILSTVPVCQHHANCVDAPLLTKLFALIHRGCVAFRVSPPEETFPTLKTVLDPFQPRTARTLMQTFVQTPQSALRTARQLLPEPTTSNRKTARLQSQQKSNFLPSRNTHPRYPPLDVSEARFKPLGPPFFTARHVSKRFHAQLQLFHGFETHLIQQLIRDGI